MTSDKKAVDIKESSDIAGGPDVQDPPTRISWTHRRRWPLILTLVVLASGMAFMFAWDPLVHHVGNWATGGDLWGIFRGAHYVAWGDLGGIYTNGNGIIAFPGMSVLLAPIAMVSSKLHLTESYLPFYLARPTAALILEPVELLLASTVIFASDALAERLDVDSRRRFWLCLVIAIVAWPTAAIWGHAEDALAVTFTLYALVAMLDHRWAKMGWLLGFGVVMQPLVALLLPLLIASTPGGQRMLVAIRSAALSAVLVGVAFLGDPSDTYRSLIDQPTPPSVNHATPWAAIAPRLNSNAVTNVHVSSLVPGLGHPAAKEFTTKAKEVVLVAGGPGRMIGVALALLLGVVVWRRPQTQDRVLWLAALVLAMRCFFEPVMTPYYLAPPLFMCLVLASRQSAKRFWVAALIALEITVFAYHHLNPWVWWLTVVAGLIAILGLVNPSRLPRGAEEPAPPLGGRLEPDWIGEPASATTIGGLSLPREPALH
jgi:hypothetical protein